METDIRPTTLWRKERDEEAERVAAGRLPAQDAHMAALYPDAFLDLTDPVLDTFADAIRQRATTPDAYPLVMGDVERVVLALNAISNVSDGWIETGEREDLCGYIEQVIAQHGIDVDLLAASQGVGVHELTNQWREW